MWIGPIRRSVVESSRFNAKPGLRPGPGTASGGPALHHDAPSGLSEAAGRGLGRSPSGALHPRPRSRSAAARESRGPRGSARAARRTRPRRLTQTTLAVDEQASCGRSRGPPRGGSLYVGARCHRGKRDPGTAGERDLEVARERHERVRHARARATARSFHRPPALLDRMSVPEGNKPRSSCDHYRKCATPVPHGKGLSVSAPPGARGSEHRRSRSVART